MPISAESPAARAPCRRAYRARVACAAIQADPVLILAGGDDAPA